jgi:Xaa-Pro dipeptidase
MISMKARLAKVFDNVSVNQILIINTGMEDSNFLYLTGFKDGLFEGSVLLVKRNSMALFVSPLEYGIAKRERPKEMKLVLLDKAGKMSGMLKKELHGKRVGVNGAFLPYNLHQELSSLIKARFVDISKQMLQARLVKDESELKTMRKAVSITKKALSMGRSSLKVGMTERQVAAVIDSTMKDSGAEPAFASIVSFDSNTALPHYGAGGARLRKNSIVLFDIGAKVDNYCADMTRTFMFKPDPKSAKFKRFSEIHSVVSEAQKLALEKIKEGARASAAHIAAANYIDRYGGGIYRGKFIHALGHSIGIDVHDGGAGLYPGCKQKLKRNMVFSDEPGIYIEGFGGVRLEDDVIVGKSHSKFI